MIKIEARINITQVMKSFSVADSQLDYAIARALTKTAQSVKAAERAAIAQSFDKPNPYTLNSVFMSPAKKARLEARVWLKDVWSKGGQGHHYLEPQIFGGDRSRKRTEVRLQMLGYLPSGYHVVPTKFAPKDAYGNINRGVITKILSQLNTAVVAGDYSNATNSKRSRAKRAVTQYFVSRGPGSQRRGLAGRRSAQYPQHLPAGVWERRVHAWGTSVRPMLLFVKATRYNKRFDFFGVAQSTIDRYLLTNAQEAATEAMRTARFKTQGGLF